MIGLLPAPYLHHRLILTCTIWWWLGLKTSHGSQCALRTCSFLDPLGHHALTCKCRGDAIFYHNTTGDILAESFHRAYLSVQVEVHAGSGLSADLSRTRPADILDMDRNTRRPATFDICVVSRLN